MLARCSRRASAAMVLPTFDITRALVDPNAHHQAAGLSYILQRLRLHLIPLTAHDVYQLCTTAYHTNTLGLMEDAEVMRALADAFQRADQRVLTPFQVSLITDTLRKAGIVATPTEVLVPTEEEVSPESVLHLLRSMRVNKMRDERKTDAALNLLIPFLDEMNPTTLSAIIIELALLRSSKADMMNRLGKRVLHVSDELTTLDLSMTTKCLALTRGVPTNLLRRLYDAVSARMEELQPEDFVHAMEGLCQLGPQFANTFAVFVEAGLEQVETFDALTLTHFLVGFTTMKYAQRDHVEIYADALIDVAQDLGEHDLVQATMALESLHLLSEDLFSSLSTCLLRFTPRMAPRYIAPVMDVCSVVPHDSSMLMQSLLDRALEATRVLSPNELANILEIASMYPPTKTHAVVGAFAKQAKMRMEIMAPESISTIVRGLANLGHDDAEVYVMATSAMMRFGFKNWSTLEPILMGLSLSGECSIATAKVMAGHLAPMARTMTVAEVQRANRYLMEIKCEEDFVYRALAARVLYFVKELTPDTPEDVQVLLQRGAVRRDDR